MTVKPQRVRKAVATIFAGALLAAASAAAVPAPAQAAVDPEVCKMGIRLAQGYWDRGDIATGNKIIWNLVDMGCAEGGAAPAQPALAE